MPVEQPIGTAVLYVLSNVRPAMVDAFNEWCDTIHHFDTMRVDGFLSLRRFRLVAGVIDDGAPEYHILTLYQVEKAGDADFTTPSYAHHSATYTPPPPGVVDGVAFVRTVYERVQRSGASTQRVGAACLSLVGTDGPWLDAAAAAAAEAPGFLGVSRVADDDESVLLIDVEDEPRGRDLLATLTAIDHGGRRKSVQLFAQVFPRDGVLLRDRRFRTSVA